MEERFGPLTVDLAASNGQEKAPIWIPPEANSLTVEWAHLYEGNMWLNPPFGRIAPWAQMCMLEGGHLRHPPRKGKIPRGVLPDRILFLTPASVGANWFEEYVWGEALVLFLKPRLVFDGMLPNPRTGEMDPYPKDLMLSVYGEKPGLELWRWK